MELLKTSASLPWEILVCLKPWATEALIAQAHAPFWCWSVLMLIGKKTATTTPFG